MRRGNPFWTLGLMSGTSLDGVDAALLCTDGERVERFGKTLTIPYPSDLRNDLRTILGGAESVGMIEKTVTMFHADVARKLIELAPETPPELVGFHGHTILHRPKEGRTWQIGNGSLLSKMLGLPVVNDFRSADIAAGGEGAPLVPAFHAALARNFSLPVAIVNIGGVANVTWVGGEDNILAFDTGPGNALLDDWLVRHTGQLYDEDGRLASQGMVAASIVDQFLAHDYFFRPPPKSLDRDDFGYFVAGLLDGINAADGAATLAVMTAMSIHAARLHFPEKVNRWLICGGGRHNLWLMDFMRSRFEEKLDAVEAVGWDGDALEANAFAYLAVRSLHGFPISWPQTTGVKVPQTGGVVHWDGVHHNDYAG